MIWRLLYGTCFFAAWQTADRLDAEAPRLLLCFVMALCLDRWLANA